LVVAVLPNLDKHGSAEVVEKLGAILKNEGIDAYLPDTVVATDFKHAPEDELFKIADVIITIGGDGNIRRYAKRAAQDHKPVLGINAGRMGYLANLEQNELNLISKLKDREYFTERRMMLSVTVMENGNVIGEYNALNDAVITSGFISRIIDVSATVGYDSISYRADGLIISTPTGSTAYSMSAGGPVIDPALECIAVTPICPHQFGAKPMVFSPSTVLGVVNRCNDGRKMTISLDGHMTSELSGGETFYVRKASMKCRFVRIKQRVFCNTLKKIKKY